MTMMIMIWMVWMMRMMSWTIRRMRMMRMMMERMTSLLSFLTVALQLSSVPFSSFFSFLSPLCLCPYRQAGLLLPRPSLSAYAEACGEILPQLHWHLWKQCSRGVCADTLAAPNGRDDQGS